MKINLDKIFWISFIFYFDPGGLIYYYFSNDIFWRISFTDVFFLIMMGCYYLLNKKISRRISIINISLKQLQIFFLIWIFYFIFFYGLIIPQSNLLTFVEFLIKTRYVIMCFMLFPAVYTFSFRSIKIFIRYFVNISIIILGSLLISITISTSLIPVFIRERKFIDAQRIVLFSYGCMPWLINLLYVIILFKMKISNKYKLIISGIMMIFAWGLSLTRRHIIGSIILFVIYMIIYLFVYKKPIISLKLTKRAVSFIVIMILIFSFFPKIRDNTFYAFNNAIQKFTGVNDNNNDKEEYRITLNQPFLTGLIQKNPLTGTGYTKNWYIGEKSSEGGEYETSDYPLLAAIAAYGLIGIVVFLFFYIWLIRLIVFILKYLRKNITSIINVYPVEILIIISITGFLIYELIQYMNLFHLTGLSRGFAISFFFLALMLGQLKRIDYEKVKLILDSHELWVEKQGKKLNRKIWKN